MATLHDHTVRRIGETDATFLRLEAVNILWIFHSHSSLVFARIRELWPFEKIKQTFEPR